MTQTIDSAKWYVVHVQSGYELKTKTALEQRIKSLGMENKIFKVVVPMRDAVVIKQGKKKSVKEKVYPGYILVKMILDDQSWLVVRGTEGVTGFVGAGSNPTPISDKEMEAILKHIQEDKPKYKAKISVGEAVKIKEEPFMDFLGTVQQIDEDKGKAKVLVSIFGRETPVEVDLLKLEKIN
ncbi:MAG: transcription termination/antitermination protein NusG [Patescibacteria group bacterium]|nr:MAG: transcription termination/antitermination protein NusG [Patescibacteria group bacterium]